MPPPAPPDPRSSAAAIAVLADLQARAGDAERRLSALSRRLETAQATATVTVGPRTGTGLLAVLAGAGVLLLLV